MIFCKSFELFTTRIIYNDPVSMRPCEARTQNWHQMSTSVSFRLPPDHDSSKQHCLWPHLQDFERRNATCMKALIPSRFGWDLKSGTLVPIMHNTHALLHKRFRNSSHLMAPDECAVIMYKYCLTKLYIYIYYLVIKILHLLELCCFNP